MDATTRFTQFQEGLYRALPQRANSGMELLNALCSTPNARLVVELSLSPQFRRSHAALYKAIHEIDWAEINPLPPIRDALRAERGREYWLLGVDGTPQRRQWAYTLKDRGYVYFPNPVAGNKPVAIGHEYSTVAILPPEGEWCQPVGICA